MRAVRVVIGTGRDQFDGVATEDGQITEILVPGRNVPAIVRVGLLTITKLVAAQLHPGRTGDLKIVRQHNVLFPEVEFAKEKSDTVENSPVIRAVDDDARLVCRDAEA